MNTLSILIVVDAIGSLASDNLMNNVYMVDSNKYLGSWQEGTDMLHTICQDGQQINWSITSIAPSNNVEIAGFSGDMVSKGICVPEVQGLGSSSYWAGLVQTHGSYASYSYTITVSLDEREMNFSPYIKSV